MKKNDPKNAAHWVLAWSITGVFISIIILGTSIFGSRQKDNIEFLTIRGVQFVDRHILLTNVLCPAFKAGYIAGENKELIQGTYNLSREIQGEISAETETVEDCGTYLALVDQEKDVARANELISEMRGSYKTSLSIENWLVFFLLITQILNAFTAFRFDSLSAEELNRVPKRMRKGS